ncbi:MAG: hypothetical protein E5X88_21055 [Mesorhizobium sp.]|uniref:hypothetical protein n=1 Tax=Mesorhizobium sp. TaxID=1871066 RepID=UPI00120CBE9C|nr:hypothetical protein [Mesorhizobium sp.]TIO06906.1 MAG: hypothetical protein E5X88_21055 [Mesorhizobium sp.]
MTQTIITQKLTEAGILGVILILVGPAIVGFALMGLSGARRSFDGVPPDVTWLYIVAALGVVLSAMAMPLIIVGRQYTVTKAE